MKLKIFGEEKNIKDLFKKVSLGLEELGLSEFIKLEKTNSKKLKEELEITKEPALIIEEESIDFKDMIFEGITPSDEEIKSMLVSIVGAGDSGSCSGNCHSCSSC